MDNKAKEILELQDKGISRLDISIRLNYKLVSSMDRFMRNNGFSLSNGKYIQKTFVNSTKNESSHECPYCKNIKINRHQISFKELDSQITERMLSEFDQINNKFSINEQKALAFLLLKSIFYNEDKDDKRINLIKNVRTFFEVAFKTNMNELKSFLIKMNIPCDFSSFDNYNSVRSFIRQDKSINDYLDSLSIDGLEELRKELSYINSFTKNFQKALRTTE